VSLSAQPWSPDGATQASSAVLATLTHEQFARCRNQMFRLQLGAAILDLELIHADALGTPQGSAGQRRPFSLVFRGPREPVLGQRTYTLEHPQMHVLDLFLVPIGPDRNGMRYEAIFT